MTKQNKKMYIAIGFICLIFLVLIFRAFQLQVLKHSEYKKKGIALSTDIKEIESRRGDIKDRNGEPLATTIKSYDFWVTQSDVGYDEMDSEELNEFESDLKYLKSTLGIDPKLIKDGLNGEDTSFSIKKDVTTSEFEKVREKLPDWIAAHSKYKRIYPLVDISPRVIGIIDSSNNGILGIELSYDDTLRGLNGKSIIDTDSRNTPLASSTNKQYESIDGSDLVLTCDKNIMYYTHSWLKKCYEEKNATNVIGIVMESKTGEILAMETYPTFDSNSPYEVTDEQYNGDLNLMWKNHAVSILYEPGSVGKLITMAAGLESGSFTRNTQFYDETGKTVYQDGTTIYCHVYPDNHGVQDAGQALLNSCNTAFVQMSEMIGKENMLYYLDAFGITEKVDIALPNVLIPQIVSRDSINAIELASMSFGYSYSVVPLQMIVASNAVANDGNLVKPKIVKEIISQDNEVEKTFENKIVRKVISTDNSNIMKDMMESIFEDGEFDLPENTVQMGSKTGTAYRLDSGLYGSDYNASYFVTAPIDDPEYSILIIAESPEHGTTSTSIGYYASNLMADILNYKGHKESDPTEKIGVPSVLGETPNEAYYSLSNFGLSAHMLNVDDTVSEDKFHVVRQFPDAGSELYPNGRVILIFEKEKEEKEKSEIETPSEDEVEKE